MDRSSRYKADPYLLTRSLQPENQETPIQFIKTDIIDNKLFYRRSKQLIKGIAWTGKGFVTKTEISVDGGSTWLNAKLEPAKNAGYGWKAWSYEWTVLRKAEYMIMSKATDSYGRTQPAVPFWNKKGYGYNAIDKINVKVK
ncbi:molybdopterin-binding protein [Domibacillus indicus]|uniref:hypothetical protein n=1 Tax=Domibacillus indicus TaxID=1437523 RepID=UPI00061805D6|nr:hypothetical protein [Domibacillus indicus]